MCLGIASANISEVRRSPRQRDTATLHGRPRPSLKEYLHAFKPDIFEGRDEVAVSGDRSAIRRLHSASTWSAVAAALFRSFRTFVI